MIKCPKCQAICDVPAPAAEVPVEVVEEEESVQQPNAGKAKAREEDEDRPRSKRKSADDDDDDPPRRKKSADDDDDEDDDRPRNRKRRDDDDEDARTRRRRERRNTGSYGVLIVTTIGILLLAGVAFSIYWFGIRGKASATRDSEGWEIYTSPDNMFRVSFPGRSEPLEWKPVHVKTTTSEIRIYKTGSNKPDRPSLTFFAGYVRIPEDNKLGLHFVEAHEVAKMLSEHMTPTTFGKHQGDSGEEGTSIVVGGRQWLQSKRESGRFGSGYMRQLQVGPTHYVIGYRSEQQEAPKEMVDKFLASFEVLGDPEPEQKQPEPKKQPEPIIQQPRYPLGWVEFKPNGVDCKSLLPPNLNVRIDDISFSNQNLKKLIASTKRFQAVDPDGNTVYELYVVQWAPGVSMTEAQTTVRTVALIPAAGPKAKFKPSANERDIVWGGQPAREMQYLPQDRGFARFMTTTTTGYAAVCYGETTKPDPEKAKVFMDGFVWDK
jgi:hypothetical protein